MSGRSQRCLGLTRTVGSYCVLLNTMPLVGIEPRSSRFGVRRSTTIAPRSLNITSSRIVGNFHTSNRLYVLSCRICSEAPELDTKCEIIWCKLNIIGCRILYLGSFYRPPKFPTQELELKYLEDFNTSLSGIMSNKMPMFL